MLRIAKQRIPLKWKFLAHQLSCTTTGRLADLVLPPARKVVIVANARTGSNLLRSYLDHTPGVTAHGEIFGTYYTGDPFMLAHIQHKGAVKHLEEMLRRRISERVVCAKLLYRDFDENYRRIKNIPSMADLFDYLKSEKDIRIIHLRRENLLDVVLSMELAKRTGKFVGDHYNIGPVEIDPKYCHRQFEVIKASEELCRSAFQGPRCIEITYQQLSSDTSAALKKLQDFLNVGPINATSHYKKQNKDAPGVAISNYEELKAHFDGTPFERYFEEAS